MLQTFPRRAIHLDFHTGPDIPDVGRDFDAEEFAETFAAAHVDSVTVFAKCHHGLLYYDTDRPERHPGLPRTFNLLEAQIEALHRRGIKAPIYVSGPVDQYAATQHPEWCAVDPEGRLVKRGGPLEAGWYVLDMSSPYQDYLAEQLAEILAKFSPTDGIFLDMCWNQPSCSKWAIADMRKRGYDPAREADRRTHAHVVAHDYMARYKAMIDDAHKAHRPVGIWFNSRQKTDLFVEKKFARHVEIECLPTGGWGYAYFPYVARFVRPLGLPTLSMTARFHKTWADFGGLKPEAALLYECASSLSLGLSSSVGDQMHPRGTLDKAAYSMIERVYRHIRDCETWVEGGRLQSEIAVIINPGAGENPGPEGLGLIRSLQELRQQFDLLPAEGDIRDYKVVIVPESILIGADLKAKLQEFLRAGGALLVSGKAALDEDGAPIMAELGIAAHGESPFTVTYLRPGPSIAQGLPDMDHVMYERGLRLTPTIGAKTLCQVVEPYFERTYQHFCSHNQTPPDQVSSYASVVEHGTCITFACPIFTAYGTHGNIVYRQLLGRCLDRLLPEPLIRDNGPAHMEATVIRKATRTIVHLLSFYPSRRTFGGRPEIIEDPIPLVNVNLSVKLDDAPRRALLLPGGEELPLRYEEGRAAVAVSTAAGHAMVVFE